MSFALQSRVTELGFFSTPLARPITLLPFEASQKGRNNATHPRADPRKTRSRIRSRNRIVRRHNDCCRLDDWLRHFYRGGRDLTPDRLSGWIVAHLDHYRPPYGFRGGFVWRIGGDVPACRRPIYLSQGGVFTALGLSLRLDT